RSSTGKSQYWFSKPSKITEKIDGGRTSHAHHTKNKHDTVTKFLHNYNI
ncbi:MAG: hypothetical protein ACI90V_012317, partial [Bacillariaceae sp.]